jgi:hypothetical protein
LHLQPCYLRKLCRGMSCLTSPILSLAWDRLRTKTARSSSQKQQSQSTTQMAIQSSQAGEMRLVHGYSIFLSPLRLLSPRMRLVPQRLGRPSQLLLRFWRHYPGSRDCPLMLQQSFRQPCLRHHTLIQARASLPLTRPGLPAWSTTYTVQPRRLPWPFVPQVPYLTHAALISPALGPCLGSIMPAWASLSSKLGLMLSKPATETPSRASPTPMQPSTVRMPMRRSWAILPSNDKMSGRLKPSQLCRHR